MHPGQAQNQAALRQFAFQYEGTLIAKAELRTKLLDNQGTSVPCVCMDVELDNELHTQMHVERPYPADQYDQAKADAQQLKRGARVSIDVPMLDLRLLVRNAAQVQLLAPSPNPTKPAAQAAPTPNAQEPELWPA